MVGLRMSPRSRAGLRGRSRASSECGEGRNGRGRRFGFPHLRVMVPKRGPESLIQRMQLRIARHHRAQERPLPFILETAVKQQRREDAKLDKKELCKKNIRTRALPVPLCGVTRAGFQNPFGFVPLHCKDEESLISDKIL
jgi:hypothetical protein